MEEENVACSQKMADARPSRRDTDPSSSNRTPHFSKPSLSYIALIATVILSSPCQKLNLASIYRAMEERFPHLQGRGPGWRNSVRHNLSVNTCFVKVGRCEDGRGHYWGIHGAHLRDFQHGNFRQYRKAGGRRETDRPIETETGNGSDARSLGFRRNLPNRDLWSVGTRWDERPCWVRRYCFPRRMEDAYGHALARSSPLTSGLPSWKAGGPGAAEPYDGGFTAPPLQLFAFPRCCCDSPVLSRLTQPSPYY